MKQKNKNHATLFFFCYAVFFFFFSSAYRAHHRECVEGMYIRCIDIHMEMVAMCMTSIFAYSNNMFFVAVFCFYCRTTN